MSDTEKLCKCGHPKSVHNSIGTCESTRHGQWCYCEKFVEVDSQPELKFNCTNCDNKICKKEKSKQHCCSNYIHICPVSKEPSRETNPRVHRHDTYNPDVCAADCPACAWQEGFDARKDEISRLKSLPEKIFAELDKRKDRTTMNVSGYQIEWGIVKSVFAEQAKLQKQSEQEGE